MSVKLLLLSSITILHSVYKEFGQEGSLILLAVLLLVAGLKSGVIKDFLIILWMYLRLAYEEIGPNAILAMLVGLLLIGWLLGNITFTADPLSCVRTVGDGSVTILRCVSFHHN
jgi:hypothetical protein